MTIKDIILEDSNSTTHIYHSIFLYLIIYFISNRTLPRRRNRVRHTAPFSWKRCLLERNNIYAEQFVWRRKPPVPGKCAHSSCCSRNNGPEKGTRISKSHNYWLRHWSIDEKPWKSASHRWHKHLKVQNQWCKRNQLSRTRHNWECNGSEYKPWRRTCV